MSAVHPQRRDVRKAATIEVEVVCEYDNGTVRVLLPTPIEYTSRHGDSYALRPSIIISKGDLSNVVNHSRT